MLKLQAFENNKSPMRRWYFWWAWRFEMGQDPLALCKCILDVKSVSLPLKQALFSLPRMLRLEI